MARPLTDEVIIITGASSGIGAATAAACARAGMHAVIHGRDAERLEQTASAVRACGREAVCVTGDVTGPGMTDRLLTAAGQRFGGFYAVFANAGYGWRKPAHEAGDTEVRRMFDVNFFAACDLLSEAARRLIAARRPGHLLVCSSALAKFTMRDFSAYSASKAAQHHVCRAMGMELRPYRIAVSSVHPITTRTAFLLRSMQYAGKHPDPAHLFDHVPPRMLQSAERVADAVVRCLRRPRPEVWTSRLTQFAAALMCVWPRFMDVVGTRGR